MCCATCVSQQDQDLQQYSTLACVAWQHQERPAQLLATGLRASVVSQLSVKSTKIFLLLCR